MPIPNSMNKKPSNKDLVKRFQFDMEMERFKLYPGFNNIDCMFLIENTKQLKIFRKLVREAGYNNDGYTLYLDDDQIKVFVIDVKCKSYSYSQHTYPFYIEYYNKIPDYVKYFKIIKEV